MQKIREKIKLEASNIHREIKNKVAGYIAAAFGLVAGLAWNDAIKALISYLFPLEKNGLLAKFLYAILITLILIIVSLYIVRAFKSEKKEEEKKQNS